jgi:hypothetical protein
VSNFRVDLFGTEGVHLNCKLLLYIWLI